MNTLRTYKYPIFIGTGLVAAGAMFYFIHSGVNSQHTQGAIGQREVYRDTQVNASDVNANPGSAPVATKALMETKEFKALEKNAAFQDLMRDSSFQSLSQNVRMYDLMHNEAFLTLAQNGLFVHFMQQPAMADLAQWMSAQSAAQLQTPALTEHLNAALTAANAQSLMKNDLMRDLFKNDAFQGLMRTFQSSQSLIHMLNQGSFQSLMRDSNFQGLMMQSSFQNAMIHGAAANLSSQLASGMQAK
jgi:hypothetical protein